MKKKFQVKSSDGVTNYLVEFLLEDEKLYVYCNCPAGVLGKWCKHKMQLMSDDISGVSSSSTADDMVELRDCVSKSDFARLLAEVKLAEDAMREAKVKMDSTKKALERAAQKGVSV